MQTPIEIKALSLFFSVMDSRTNLVIVFSFGNDGLRLGAYFVIKEESNNPDEGQDWMRKNKIDNRSEHHLGLKCVAERVLIVW